jgi:hypothetical protein
VPAIRCAGLSQGPYDTGLFPAVRSTISACVNYWAAARQSAVQSNLCGAAPPMPAIILHRHQAPGADVLQFHAALEAAGGDPPKGDAVAVLRVDIGLHLEHKAGDGGSSGEIGRESAGCGRDAGPIRRRRSIAGC